MREEKEQQARETAKLRKELAELKGDDGGGGGQAFATATMKGNSQAGTHDLGTQMDDVRRSLQVLQARVDDLDLEDTPISTSRQPLTQRSISCGGRGQRRRL
jgi:hypothetical protein